MRLHYSKVPLGEIVDRAQDGRAFMLGLQQKPSGLWYSFGDEWPRFCRVARWRMGDLAYAYELTLVEGARIVRLATFEDVVAFVGTYGIDPHGLSHPTGIDWQRVALEYDGIEVHPFTGDPAVLVAGIAMSYSGWDCSSGCVWRRSAIASVIERPERAYRVRGTARAT